MTPAGVPTSFALPTADDRALDITGGPDGNVWFTNRRQTLVPDHFGGVIPSFADFIGRITPTGTITLFPIGVGNPTGITAGPDGALWFTNHDSGTIGRITTAGAVSTYVGPTGSARGRRTSPPGPTASCGSRTTTTASDGSPRRAWCPPSLGSARTAAPGPSSAGRMGTCGSPTRARASGASRPRAWFPRSAGLIKLVREHWPRGPTGTSGSSMPART